MSPLARTLASWLLLVALLAPACAHACTLNVGNMSFGTISGASGGDSTMTMVFDCNTDSAPRLLVCISIFEPVAPYDVQNRRLPGQAPNYLSYNLYSDVARTQVWGSVFSTLLPPALTFPVANGKVHANITAYGRVAPGQGTLPNGNYSVSFPPISIQVGILPYTKDPPDCSRVSLSPGVAQGNMYVSANLAAPVDCAVSATPIDFGQKGALDSNTDVSGTVTARCGGGTSYTLSMSRGTSIGATLNGRLLTRGGGSETLKYGLYSNPARTSVWGDGTSGTVTVGGTGNGANQSYPVYARLPAQTPVPRPGTYTDTITLTITY